MNLPNITYLTELSKIVGVPGNSDISENTILIAPGQTYYKVKAKKITYIDANGELFYANSNDEGFCEVPFNGLNSNVEITTRGEKGFNLNEIKNINKKITKNLNSREQELLKILKEKTKNSKNNYVYVIREVSFNIAKLMGVDKTNNGRVNICAPIPKKTNSYGIYGYESFVIGLVEE